MKMFWQIILGAVVSTTTAYAAPGFSEVIAAFKVISCDRNPETYFPGDVIYVHTVKNSSSSQGRSCFLTRNNLNDVLDSTQMDYCVYQKSGFFGGDVNDIEMRRNVKGIKWEMDYPLGYNTRGTLEQFDDTKTFWITFSDLKTVRGQNVKLPRGQMMIYDSSRWNAYGGQVRFEPMCLLERVKK